MSTNPFAPSPLTAEETRQIVRDEVLALHEAFGEWDRAEVEKLCVALDAIGVPNGNKAAAVAASKIRKMLGASGSGQQRNRGANQG